MLGKMPLPTSCFLLEISKIICQWKKWNCLETTLIYLTELILSMGLETRQTFLVKSWFLQCNRWFLCRERFTSHRHLVLWSRSVDCDDKENVTMNLVLSGAWAAVEDFFLKRRQPEGCAEGKCWACSVRKSFNTLDTFVTWPASGHFLAHPFISVFV